MFASLLLAAATAAQPVPAKLVVLSTRAERAAEKDLAGTLTELVLSSLAKGHGVHVVGETDVVPFLDEAAQKQLASCHDDAACLVEIGGALGTDYLVSVSLGALGKNYLVSARFLDAKKGLVAQRASRTIPRSEDALAEAICPFMQELLAGLAQKDPRVGGSADLCNAATPVAQPEPVKAPAPPVKVEPPPAKVADATQPEEPTPFVPDPPAADSLHFGVRAGVMPTVGSLGVALEVSFGKFAFTAGTGSYLVGAGLYAHFLDRRRGPFLAVTGVMADRGPLAGLLNPIGRNELAPASAGIAGNALLGWDLPLGDRFNLRAGVGFAYNPQYWGKAIGENYYAPVCWEFSIGPTY